MKDIKKRIKELEKEIIEHQKQFNQLKVIIVSKSGAIVELKKLVKDEKKQEVI